MKRNISTIKPGINLVEKNELTILDSVIEESDFIKSMVEQDPSQFDLYHHKTKNSGNFSNISEIPLLNDSTSYKQRLSGNIHGHFDIKSKNITSNKIKNNEKRGTLFWEENENDNVFAFTLPKYQYFIFF